MKFFQTTRKSLAWFGFEKHRSAFNSTQRWIIFVSILANILQIVYFFRMSTTPKQYMDLIFSITTGILVIISTISTMFKTAKIFEIMDDIERIVTESKC